MKRIAFLFFATVTIYSCQSSRSSASKMMKLNLQKGQAYDYDMITDFGQEIMGQEMKMSMNMGYSLEVTADSGNVRTINTAINRIKMDMQMMAMKFSIDSDKPASEADTTTMQGKLSLAFSKL